MIGIRLVSPLRNIRSLANPLRHVRFNTTVVKQLKDPFTPEQRESARLARLANLGWLRHLPEKWIPYAELLRLEKPVGTSLLLVPSFWAITMASYSIAAPLTTFLYATSLFSVGALVMRGAGCIINDMLDKDLDNKVLRTVERPIASGRVSRNQAFTFLASQMFIGLGVLLSLPFECFYLGALSLPFISLYPLFKRFTYYPQVMISICFSWGCLLGFPAVGAPLDLSIAGPLFFSNFCWSMIYDSIYAHQDKEFDKTAGVKSTALVWKDNTKKIVNSIFVVQALSFFTAGFMANMGLGFYSFGAYGFYRLFNRIKQTDLDNPASCWFFFTDNVKTGLYFWAGMLVDYLMLLFI
ncbi:4-hydroxybenzoate polyprenyltransferase, mitochondrial [[Candida] jaroonii]|uniref:4-hydroxybenzoate polyprenyltransferase, mitochondrial n=1 Tax=[Candida] jaroonii TaxID=467808 RepID=A0ACA9Y728_9ASCO|nr:4-hydroxybenzoate polyprenyltransferase, mitochondrial [[Candida] jaroonii]